MRNDVSKTRFSVVGIAATRSQHFKGRVAATAATGYGWDTPRFLSYIYLFGQLKPD